MTGRFSALTMPEVTVPDRPSGDPTATTVWPTTSEPDEPRVAGVRPETPLALTTARSVDGSRPTMVASTVVLSGSVTCSEPPFADSDDDVVVGEDQRRRR